MRGLPFYEDPKYHKYLLSQARRDLFPVSRILNQLPLHSAEDILDFGMGNGYFLDGFLSILPEESHVWGAECQELLIDFCLQRKVKEKIERFTPFYVERTEHPLLPDWIPPMDLIFCSCVMSTFADPTLALRGIGRVLKPDGPVVVIDWERREAPSGPELIQKVSRDRMEYFIDESGYSITQRLRINEFVYGLVLQKNPEKFEETVYYQM
ncbi:MAG: methyltransferase domain-containing protein [Leptospiraceae bacterium]|nr:methyltransferase domain-containing protein [Leptospiraceae bacterium]